MSANGFQQIIDAIRHPVSQEEAYRKCGVVRLQDTKVYKQMLKNHQLMKKDNVR